MWKRTSLIEPWINTKSPGSKYIKWDVYFTEYIAHTSIPSVRPLNLQWFLAGKTYLIFSFTTFQFVPIVCTQYLIIKQVLALLDIVQYFVIITSLYVFRTESYRGMCKEEHFSAKLANTMSLQRRPAPATP